MVGEFEKGWDAEVIVVMMFVMWWEEKKDEEGEVLRT